MQKAERMAERFPRFHKVWDHDSVLFKFLTAFALTLEEQRKDLFGIMRAHWVDTAYGIDLDLLGALFRLRRRVNESDEDLRRRIKTFIAEFRGGGTIHSILTVTRLFLGLKDDENLILLENPPTRITIEKKVKNGDTLLISSRSINDEEAALTLSLEEKDLEVEDPSLTNMDTNYSVKFNGRMRSGQTLLIKNGKAELDGRDVSDKVSTTSVKLPRKASTWMYQEALSAKIGRFDQAYFDRHIFETDVPGAQLQLDWTARLLAAFELKVPSRHLERTGIAKEDFKELVNAIKAAGIKAIVTYE